MHAPLYIYFRVSYTYAKWKILHSFFSKLKGLFNKMLPNWLSYTVQFRPCIVLHGYNSDAMVKFIPCHVTEHNDGSTSEVESHSWSLVTFEIITFKLPRAKLGSQRQQIECMICQLLAQFLLYEVMTVPLSLCLPPPPRPPHLSSLQLAMTDCPGFLSPTSAWSTGPWGGKRRKGERGFERVCAWAVYMYRKGRE